MKGSAGIFIIISILIAGFIGFLFYTGVFNSQKAPISQTYKNLSEDPKYKEVKEKYNLSEEQLQILSTVDPEDNE